MNESSWFINSLRMENVGTNGIYILDMRNKKKWNEYQQNAVFYRWFCCQTYTLANLECAEVPM